MDLHGARRVLAAGLAGAVTLLRLAWAAGPVFTEDSQGGLEWQQGRAAWGRHHVWLGGGSLGRERQLGLPAGVVGLCPGPGGLWAALADGELRRLAPEPALVWRGSTRCRAVLPLPGGRAWLLGEEGLLLLRLCGASSPEVLVRLPLPAGGPPWEMRGAGSGAWLRCGDRVHRLDADGSRWVARLPRDWRDWVPWGGALLGLDGEGGPAWLPPAGTGPGEELGARPPLPRPGPWDRLWRGAAALWLHAQEGAWWRWEGPPDEPRLVETTARNALWLPAGDDLLLAQTVAARQWWARREDGSWRLEAETRRSPALRDRLVRQAGDWRLEEDGRLRLGGAEGWRDLGRHDGARALCRAGAGPLLLVDGGLRAFSEEGRLIGGWQGLGGRQACALEDHLLLAGEDRLRIFWTGEEDPWLQAELSLPGAWEVTASPVAAAVVAEGMVEAVDLGTPWRPARRGAAPLPPGTASLLMVEDKLLLAAEAGLAAWRLAGEGWRGEPLPGGLGGASWLCPRGAGRVLALSAAGRLAQLRLQDNLPVAEEWSCWLPLAGRPAVARDTLRVLGEAGWLDWPLPPLPPEAPGSAPGDEVEAWPRLPLTPAPGGPAGTALPALRREGGTLRILWTGPGAPPGRVAWRLHDLAGRRLREGSLEGRPMRLDLAGLPAGAYVLSLRGADGAGHDRMLVWRP